MISGLIWLEYVLHQVRYPQSVHIKWLKKAALLSTVVLLFVVDRDDVVASISAISCIGAAATAAIAVTLSARRAVFKSTGKSPR